MSLPPPPPRARVGSEKDGTMMGFGLLPRLNCAGCAALVLFSSLLLGVSATGSMPVGADRLVLDRLKGREKLKDGRGRCAPVTDVSELNDGDRGCCDLPRARGDMGECGSDMALLEENFRGFENVEPALELL